MMLLDDLYGSKRKRGTTKTKRDSDAELTLSGKDGGVLYGVWCSL